MLQVIVLDDVIADGEDELMIADGDGHLVVWRAEQSTSRRRRLQVRKPKHGANMAPTVLLCFPGEGLDWDDCGMRWDECLFVS